MKSNDKQARSYYNFTAGLYDLMMRASAWLDGVSPHGERETLIEQLGLTASQRILEVATGTGSDLKIIAQRMGTTVELFGVDLSHNMLTHCQRKMRSQTAEPALIQANAARLPFRQDSFEVVLLFGGFNEFAEKREVVREMMRVGKPGATIVISDKSLCCTQTPSLRERLLLKLNPHLACPPPLDLLPPAISDAQVTWFWRGLAFILRFTNPGN